MQQHDGRWPYPRTPSPLPQQSYADFDLAGQMRERLRALETSDYHFDLRQLSMHERINSAEARISSVEERTRQIEEAANAERLMEQESRRLSEERRSARRDALVLFQWGFLMLVVLGYLSGVISADSLRTVASALVPGR